MGDAPDLLVFSPEGGRAFITLRGKNPATGTHDIAGQTPGVALIDVHTRKPVQLIKLDDDAISTRMGLRCYRRDNASERESG